MFSRHILAAAARTTAGDDTDGKRECVFVYLNTCIYVNRIGRLLGK